MTVFPCSDLSIGSWRRMASPQHDLIAYTSEGKRSLTWFIRSGGRSFKMEVLYEHILDARFTNVSPGMGSATFYLERPPTFYMEGLLDPAQGEDSPRIWQVCGDWTEGGQGSTQLQHTLAGPAYQLSALVNSITPTTMPGADSVLYTPTASISDAGSSPEVFTRVLHSPTDVPMHPATSSLVLRRPSSLSSLRMLHHPSLERLRARPSVPLFHSPLSSTSTPPSPYTASEGSLVSISPAFPPFMHMHMDPSHPQQQQRGFPGIGSNGKADQLAHLPLTMPNLPRLNYDYPPMSRSASPYDCSEPPSSAASTGGYFDGTPTSAPWGGGGGPPHSAIVGGSFGNIAPVPGAVVGAAFIQQHASPVEERPQEPYYPYPNGLPGPAPAYAYDAAGAAGM